MQYTNQRALRRAFWAAHPDLPRRRIRDYSGKGLMYPTDTRVTWADWLDGMEQMGWISADLAQRATLEA